MTKTRVAVLRGGPSAEYQLSMETGAMVIAVLRELGYHVQDIPISKNGEWIVDGRVKTPEKALLTTDVAFIAMRGEYGEDGTIQRLCERYHIPFTGSNSFASAVAFNKDATKRALRETLIHMPKHVKVSKDTRDSLPDVVRAVERSFGPQYIVKPVRNGSLQGVVMVESSNKLESAVASVLVTHGDCLIEEYITGVEATCAIIEDFRDSTLYVLPPVEIVHTSGTAPRTAIQSICPGRFSYEEKEKIAALATLVHTTLGLTQYSRTDCIVKDGEVYFLEVNTLPTLAEDSLFSKATAAVGMDFRTLMNHLVRTARVY
jgi:D-alanine-D-alanine ligase